MKDGTLRDRVDVLTFGVGHGDCLLVEFVQSGRVEFRLLYDGGAKLPDALLTHLRSGRREDGAHDLDVVVLSHVDNDHQGGLHQLFQEEDIGIGEFWSPCLPAFERLSWLFADRIAKAVEKAGALENAAKERRVSVIYPMEDHVERFAPGMAVTVSVVSPARRLLKRLYHAPGDIIGDLLGRTPLPLEWLIRGEGAGEPDGDNLVGSPFDSGTATSRAVLPPAPRPDSLTTEKLRERAAAAAESEGLEFSPDFFGNSVLNDTSLVVVVDVVLDRLHRRRIVLSGDQENWSYISSQHPMGLAPDVLKVPHHGGRIYLWDFNRPPAEALPMDGIGQFFIWMRPRIAVVSAKGMHSLPRSEFREAVRLVGATLVCPNKRSRELIFADKDIQPTKSCYQQFGCGATNQHEVLRLRLAAQEEELDAAACLQGNCHRGPAPVVVMQQRLVEPDESFVRWTTGEVRKQAHWLEESLRGERKELLTKKATSLVTRLSTQMTSWVRTVAEAKARGLVQFAANPGPVLRFAAAHGLIWTDDDLRWPKQPGLVAALSEAEYSVLLSWLRRSRGLLLVIKNLNYQLVERGDWFELVRCSKLEPLARLCAAKAGLPFNIFEREVMPRLIRDLASHYSGRLVSLDEPHLKAPCDGGKAMLHLYARSTEVPDFFDEDQKRLFRGLGEPELTESELTLIFSKDSVLPPFSTHRQLEPNALHPFVLEYYGRDEIWEDREDPPPGIFTRVFNKAKWKPLWTC